MKKQLTSKTTSSKIKPYHPVILAVVVFFLILTGKMLYIQATGQVDGFNLEAWAKDQREKKEVTPAKRGYIYDRNEMVLAQDINVYRLYAIVDPSFSPDPEKRLNHVADPATTAEQLAPIIGMDVSVVQDILDKGSADGRFQVEFGREGTNLTREQKLQIDALDLPGVHFIEEAKRYYPNGIFASHVIGLAQTNDDQLIEGITGIEAQLDELLTGTDGSVTLLEDRYNDPLLNEEVQVLEKQDGFNVQLTLDQKVQTILEDALSQVEAEFNPKRITATVINPKTGEIIAMGSRPSYNPNDLGNVTNWYNDIVSTPIEPGSTMKIFTLASAIEEGVYNPNETYQSGTYKIPEITRAVPDYRKHWGTITYAEGFQRSSNVAMAKLVWEKVGTETFLEYLKAFQFDQLTGIDLPRETLGRLVYRYPIEQLNAAFGQGTTVTPIQIVKAATAIANNGHMMTPYIIQSITDPNTGDVIKENTPTIAGEPISEDTAQQVLQAMESVVTEETGTANGIFELPSYTLAGKTGTAQISGGASGYLYGRENYIFSFIGMAPSEDPELLMYVTVQQPELEATESGSKPVSYIFNHVMENALHYQNIQPDKDQVSTVNELVMPVAVGLKTEDIADNLTSQGVQVTVVGDGPTITASNKTAGETILSTDHIILVTDQPKLPDLSGWSLREVVQLSNLLKLDHEIVGQGYLEKQSIEPGTPIASGDYILFDFTDFNPVSPEEETKESGVE
ncbi:penicillin-binding transpeptidase domain-containing protein [Halolactibacillus miurensis]|uniref:serine-type D-Ala-D-Ala carboxypeptidase n=1 Tax=Halolactibacillus miurensis TaxID=306541 RepID=A0A1I6V207_9BACI|nr:penicillin-binding transpeptidase domain-containing protein [Halolactibacillus miurensis]SFT07751.1 penicillin-binding protein 2B [Halolactibacillus miurensis]